MMQQAGTKYMYQAFHLNCMNFFFIFALAYMVIRLINASDHNLIQRGVKKL